MAWDKRSQMHSSFDMGTVASLRAYKRGLWAGGAEPDELHFLVLMHGAGEVLSSAQGRDQEYNALCASAKALAEWRMGERMVVTALSGISGAMWLSDGES